MKIEIREPVNKIFYACKATLIIGTSGFVTGLGFALIGAEKTYSFMRHWCGEFFGERELP